MLDCHNPAYLKRQFMLVQVRQSSLNGRQLIGELTPSLCAFAFDVVLQGTSSFLLVSHQLLREGCWCCGPLWPRWYDLGCWGLLWVRHSRDGDDRYHHVSHPREREAGALPLAQGRIILTE
jgi:hypothetical protein